MIQETTQWRPRVFAGVSTGSLSPQCPSPEDRTCPVALEIADGIGFGLDGRSIVVDDGGADGIYTIQGHLDDGSCLDRDFTVLRNGADTRVSGLNSSSDYTLHRDQNVLDIKGDCDERSSSVTSMAQGVVVYGKQPTQRYFIGVSNSNVITVEGYDRAFATQVIFEEDHIKVKGATPEQTFEISKTEHGFNVQGVDRARDFSVTRTADGFVVDGAYPQQRYVVSKQPPSNS